ncbi:patatin-like phospholipase family protein [Orenia marismortui]|uniref:patatin-like phospholipase family protein n=1 Tax=Orenia marismortui TaxID=46469 RepID=UPI0003688CA1|nr:patatin-like phospholipase family protein [Orenia marismortui]
MYGLVLAGGGSKGSYQIGVWKALKELDIEISVVTGTSVGSINGALIAQGAFEKALDIWSNISVDQIINIDSQLFNEILNFNIDIRDKKNMTQLLSHIDSFFKKKGLDITPLQELIDKNIDEKRIRQSNIDFGLVTVSLTDKEAIEVFIEDIPKGKLNDYILASSYLPGFMPMKLDGKRFIDGGLYDNLPINLMIEKKIDRIIAVDLKAIGKKQPVKDKEIDILYISPSDDLGNILDFNAERANKNIQLGYLDTLKAFEKLSGVKYYLKDIPSLEELFKYINRLKREEIEGVLKLLNMEPAKTNRILYEKLIPKIAQLYDAKDEDDYDIVFIKIVEYLAQHYEIERLEIYEFDDLVNMIISRINQERSESLSDSKTPLEVIKEKFTINIPKDEVAKLILKLYEEKVLSN